MKKNYWGWFALRLLINIPACSVFSVEGHPYLSFFCGFVAIYLVNGFIDSFRDTYYPLKTPPGFFS